MPSDLEAPPAVAKGSRYERLFKIGAGGAATVYVGTSRGPLGFRQLIAIKSLHELAASDRSARASLLAEIRVASRIRHANLVDIRDVELIGDTVHLIMDYVEGASFFQLLALEAKRGERVPKHIALRILLDACTGLRALHEMEDDAGKPLGLVHRDISPQNILIGLDGVARVTDFGLTRAARSHDISTQTGGLSGKLGYLAPEYIRTRRYDSRADVFALGVVMWEALAGKRLFRGKTEVDTLDRVLRAEIPSLAVVDATLAPFDGILAKALHRDPNERYASAREFAADLAREGTKLQVDAVAERVKNSTSNINTTDTRELAADLAREAMFHQTGGMQAEVGNYVRERVGSELEERRTSIRQLLEKADQGQASETGDLRPAPRKTKSNSSIPPDAVPPSKRLMLRASLPEVKVPSFGAGGSSPHLASATEEAPELPSRPSFPAPAASSHRVLAERPSRPPSAADVVPPPTSSARGVGDKDLLMGASDTLRSIGARESTAPIPRPSETARDSKAWAWVFVLALALLGMGLMATFRSAVSAPMTPSAEASPPEPGEAVPAASGEPKGAAPEASAQDRGAGAAPARP
jgi:serine/threonine-protein kinase